VRRGQVQVDHRRRHVHVVSSGSVLDNLGGNVWGGVPRVPDLQPGATKQQRQGGVHL